jgi:hypothetical protein
MIAVAAALLRSFASDRAALALAFAAPIAFFALFGVFFRHLDDPQGMRIEIALVVSSAEPAAERLAAAIEARSGGRIAVSRASASASGGALDWVSAVVTIPRDFDPRAPAVDIESLLPLPGTGDAVAQLVAAADVACADPRDPQEPRTAVHDRTRHGVLMRAAAPGIPVLFVLFALSSLAARGLGDDEAGLAERLRSLGVPATARMLAQFAALTAIALAQLVATLAFAAISFGLVPASPLALAVAAAASAAACAAFVVALSEACGGHERFAAVAPVCTLVLAGLGGSMVPTVLLPEALAWPSSLIFTGWSIGACVRAIDGLYAPFELVSLAAFTAACLAVAALSVRRSQFQ